MSHTFEENSGEKYEVKEHSLPFWTSEYVFILMKNCHCCAKTRNSALSLINNSRIHNICGVIEKHTHKIKMLRFVYAIKHQIPSLSLWGTNKLLSAALFGLDVHTKNVCFFVSSVISHGSITYLNVSWAQRHTQKKSIYNTSTLKAFFFSIVWRRHNARRMKSDTAQRARKCIISIKQRIIYIPLYYKYFCWSKCFLWL